MMTEDELRQALLEGSDPDPAPDPERVLITGCADPSKNGVYDVATQPGPGPSLTLTEEIEKAAQAEIDEVVLEEAIKLVQQMFGPAPDSKKKKTRVPSLQELEDQTRRPGVLTNEQKMKLIEQHLATTEGRSKLAASMTQPLRARRDAEFAARMGTPVQQLPDGFLSTADPPPDPSEWEGPLYEEDDS